MKLNQRHVKWIEMLCGYMFVLKHKIGKENKVVDALCRRASMLMTMKNEIDGFAQIREMYAQDKDCVQIWEQCRNPVLQDRSAKLNYFLLEGHLFKVK